MTKIQSNIIKFSVSLGLLGFVFLKTDLNSLLGTIRHSDYNYLWPALCVAFLGLFLSTLRWQILLKCFIDDNKFFNLFRLTCLSQFYNVFVPGNIVGDIVRGYKAKKHNLSHTQGLVSVFVDRVLGGVSFVILGILGTLGAWNILKASNALRVSLIAIVSLGLLVIILIDGRIFKMFKPLLRFHDFLNSKIKHVFEQLNHYKHKKAILGKALGISILAAFINLYVFYFISISLGSNVAFKYFLFFIPVVHIVSYLPITYSGLGLREGMFVVLFTNVGMTQGQALGTSLIYFGILMILGIVGGIFYVATRFRCNK